MFVEFDLALIPKVKEKNIIKLFKRSINFITDPKNFFYGIFEFFENRYYSLKKTLPDILVVGGLASPTKLKAKHKIFAHGPDYDVYLNLRDRPINNENDRKAILLQLTMVDEVIIFDNLNPTNLISKIRPNIVVRGSEFTADQVRKRDKIPRDVNVKIFPIKKGYSTTRTIKKIRKKSNLVENNRN